MELDKTGGTLPATNMQRRGFIRNILLVTGGFIAGCNKRLNLTKDRPGVFKGKVTAEGKGVRDVVISDGFNVVMTTSDGLYELEMHAKAEHIFVSVPAGYEVPHRNNIA